MSFGRGKNRLPTLTLSPRERESRGENGVRSDGLRFRRPLYTSFRRLPIVGEAPRIANKANGLPTILPLPTGEGRGEGRN